MKKRYRLSKKEKAYQVDLCKRFGSRDPIVSEEARKEIEIMIQRAFNEALKDKPPSKWNDT